LVGAQFGIQPPPILDAQAGRFPHDQRGPPLRKHTGRKRSQRVGHFVDQGAGKAEVSSAPIGGIASSQRDLAGQPTAPFGRRDPVGRLGRTPLGVQHGSVAGLARGRRGLRMLQFRDTSDQRSLVGSGVDDGQFFEHTFDTTSGVRQVAPRS
jgi:hypothetical protein